MVIMIWNDSEYGLIKWHELRHFGRTGHISFNNPDFVRYAESLNLIVHQVGPAVASGCPVIIKPAEDMPLSAFRFVELLREAGLPESWCQPLLTTGHPVCAGLVADRRVAFFSFISTARMGLRLRSQLALGTRCALEHGGVAPVVITADADLDENTEIGSLSRHQENDCIESWVNGAVESRAVLVGGGRRQGDAFLRRPCCRTHQLTRR